MRTLGIIALCVVLLIGGAVAWVKFVAYPDYTYRYRLTLAVEIDGKVHTESSVIEVTWNGGIPFGDVGPYYPSVRGQAVFIDLEKHGVVTTSLIAPSHMQGDKVVWPEGVDAIWLVPRAFHVAGGNEVLPKLARLTGRRELDISNIPRMILFTDINDPKSARGIMPSDFAALFGPNTRLSATVEITNLPIVIDVDKKLPWYNELAARQKATGVLSRPFEFQLTYPMFVGG